jgi:undecaprenyl-diphosphatase
MGAGYAYVVSSDINIFQALIMAAVQGVTELFPVSSLGHAVLLPHLLGWDLDQSSPAFLPFLVMLHVGTALALLIYFWRDWLALLSSLVPNGPADAAKREQRRMLMLLVVGTIPAGLVGLVAEKRLAELFSEWRIVAVFLMLNGVLLFVGEWLRRRASSRELVSLTSWQAGAIGTSQAIALLPGFSRSGASLVGGLLVGLSHEAAARFSFLLATPIILAAAALEVPKLLQPDARASLGPSIVGGIVAGVCAYLSTVFLMRYYGGHEINALVPFGVYCILFGGLTLLVGH